MTSEQLIGRKGDTLQGSPVIKGTRIRVVDVAQVARLVEKETLAERIQRALPSLSLEQISAALVFWQAHSEEIEREIAEAESLYEKFAKHAD